LSTWQYGLTDKLPSITIVTMSKHQSEAIKLQLEAERLRTKLEYERSLTIDERALILEHIKWCDDEAAWHIMAANAEQHNKDGNG